MKEPVYGFIRFSECFHRSENCPVIQHLARREHLEIRKYDSETAAHKRGHLRRCRLCMGDKVFHVNGNPDNKIRLTNEQYDALTHVSSIVTAAGRPTTLKKIAEKRRTSVVATHHIVRRLIEKGLLKHDVAMGSRKAKSGSIDVTTSGKHVLKSEPVA